MNLIVTTQVHAAENKDDCNYISTKKRYSVHASRPAAVQQNRGHLVPVQASTTPPHTLMIILHPTVPVEAPGSAIKVPA